MPRSSQHTTAQPAAFELRADRAFVLHLDARAQPPRRVAGRVEHVTSGQVARVTSLRELLAFLAAVLRNGNRGDRGTAYRALVQRPRHYNLASNARGFVDEDAACSAAQPALRGRKGGTES